MVRSRATKRRAQSGPVLAALLALVAMASAQQPAQAILSSATVSPSDALVLRDIVDPATGDRWLLVRDLAHPGAPGRMVLISGPARGRTTESLAELNAPPPPPPQALKPIIRSGDPVVVEEITPVVEARFEGVALQPALRGAELDVRLKLSGMLVRAMALAPGRVEIVRGERKRR